MVNKQPTSLTSNSFPGFFPTCRPTERARERERPWKTLVTCLPESALSLRRADRREPWERGWLDMSIFSSWWNRGYFKNCRIDHTKQVYITFQISRRVFLGRVDFKMIKVIEESVFPWNSSNDALIVFPPWATWSRWREAIPYKGMPKILWGIGWLWSENHAYLFKAYAIKIFYIEISITI